VGARGGVNRKKSERRGKKEGDKEDRSRK